MSSSNLPANIMRMVAQALPRDNRETIINYLVGKDGSVELSEKQQELLRRWHAADDLMRTLRYTTREVANQLVKRFKTDTNGYSTATAWRDIEDARHVYGTTRTASKPYLLALHIERIEAAIVAVQTSGKKELLPKLFDAYSKALSMMPKEQHKVPTPTAIVFNITNNQYNLVSDSSLSAADAERVAADRLTKWEKEIEDIMFEEEVRDDS